MACVSYCTVHSPLFFHDVVEVRSMVEFEGPPSWFLNASENWGEYKMPLGRVAGGC